MFWVASFVDIYITENEHHVVLDCRRVVPVRLFFTFKAIIRQSSLIFGGIHSSAGLSSI